MSERHLSYWTDGSMSCAEVASESSESTGQTKATPHRPTSPALTKPCLPKPPLPPTPWKKLLADFKILQERDDILRDTRARWMRLACLCVSEGSMMSNTETSPPLHNFDTLNETARCIEDTQIVDAQEDRIVPPGFIPVKPPAPREDIPEELLCRSSPSKYRKSTLRHTFSWKDNKGYIVGDDGKKKSWRQTCWHVLEDPSCRRRVFYIHVAYSLLILLSVLITIISTLENLSAFITEILHPFDLGLTLLFSLEVVVRLIMAPTIATNLRSMYFWMDFAAVVPTYVRLVFSTSSQDSAIVELLCLLTPVLRLLKITRHSNGWRLLLIAFRQCFQPLSVPLFFLTLLTVFSSCIIYWVEKHSACKPDPNLVLLHGGDSRCPAELQNAFESIPHVMWFTLVTMCTVGYGDVYPHTIEGKMVCAVLIVVGVCYLSMPLTIVGSTFWTVWENRDVILIREKTKERFRGMGKEEIRAVFEMADEDESGTMCLAEFVEFVEMFNIGMQRPEILKLFRSIDYDKSAEINFEEFASFLFPEIEVDEGVEEILGRSRVGETRRSSCSSQWTQRTDRRSVSRFSY